MPLYLFEHWKQGKLSSIESVQSDCVQNAVCVLSDMFKSGVFRLKTGKVICAWCNAEIGEIENISGDTHGICANCRDIEEEKVKEYWKNKK